MFRIPFVFLFMICLDYNASRPDVLFRPFVDFYNIRCPQGLPLGSRSLWPSCVIVRVTLWFVKSSVRAVPLLDDVCCYQDGARCSGCHWVWHSDTCTIANWIGSHPTNDDVRCEDGGSSGGEQRRCVGELCDGSYCFSCGSSNSCASRHDVFAGSCGCGGHLRREQRRRSGHLWC